MDRSSFAPGVQDLAGEMLSFVVRVLCMTTALGPNFVGNTCPDGHMCKVHVYRSTAWCDECTAEIVPGSSGERCKHCSYDLCERCRDFRPLISQRSSPPDSPVPIPAPRFSRLVEPLSQSAQVLLAPLTHLPTPMNPAVDPAPVPRGPPLAGRMKLRRSPVLPQLPQVVFAYDGCVVRVAELWTWSM